MAPTRGQIAARVLTIHTAVRVRVRVMLPGAPDVVAKVVPVVDVAVAVAVAVRMAVLVFDDRRVLLRMRVCKLN